MGLLSSVSWALLGGSLPLVLSSPNPRPPRQDVFEASGGNGVLDVFQVYQPIPSPPNDGCNSDVLLMEHSFGSSYGAPFIGQLYDMRCAIALLTSRYQEATSHRNVTLILSG